MKKPDIKTIASLCTILVFLGGVVLYLAKNSSAEVNAKQTQDIALLQQSTVQLMKNNDINSANIEYIRRAIEEQNRVLKITVPSNITKTR